MPQAAVRSFRSAPLKRGEFFIRQIASAMPRKDVSFRFAGLFGFASEDNKASKPQAVYCYRARHALSLRCGDEFMRAAGCRPYGEKERARTARPYEVGIRDYGSL